MSCELDIDNCREKFIDIILFADLNYVCIAASFVHDVSLADSISNGILEVNHRRPSWSLSVSKHTQYLWAPHQPFTFIVGTLTTAGQAP